MIKINRLVTLHRPTNVDSDEQLLRLLHAIAEGTGGLAVQVACGWR